MSIILTLFDIHKSYNGMEVLKGCSFTFDNNDIYVLTGPNGSGKSTFLRICSLLERPDRGEVIYRAGDGTVLKDDINLRRRITLVLSGIGVFNTTVFNNVAYGLKIRGFKRKEIDEKVIEALEFVGLVNKMDQNARMLSSGEMQRLGMARALVIEPDVLFLDEPTASVDMKNTEIIEDIILRLRDSGKTIIITTHDQMQAKRLGNNILNMRDGKIVRLDRSVLFKAET